MLFNYLDKQPGIAHRQLYKDERIIPRLDYLNNEFFSSFVPINNSFIHRTESDSCYNKIISGESIIIHGKAGSGKSGCVFELLEHLKEDNIIHLALKLDRRIPEHTSEKYGQSLGLPTSPVYCLDAISKCTSSDLVKQWWEQLLYNYEITNNSSSQLIELKDKIVNNIDRTGKLMIPIQLLGSYSMLGKEYLLSNGLLLLNGNNLGFVHQSIYDYFSMEKMLTRIFEGDSIFNIIGPRTKQTPMKRYHLQMLFENLMDYDMDRFINIGNELLHNEEVLFYMKYVFLEVLGQAESISQNAKAFLNEFLSNKYWKNHIVDAVLMNHPTFIRLVIELMKIGMMRYWTLYPVSPKIMLTQKKAK